MVMKKRARLVLAFALSVGLMGSQVAYAQTDEVPVAPIVEEVGDVQPTVPVEDTSKAAVEDEAPETPEGSEEATETETDQMITTYAVRDESLANKTLTILHTNDIHGHVEDEPNDDGETGKIGYAKYAGVIEQFKEEGPTIVLDAGDATQGTNFVTLSEGESMIELMNQAGVDFFVPGNHEFDYSLDQALTLQERSDFPWLASNVFDEEGNLVFQEGQIVELDGIKVGIFGMATPETKYKASPKNTEGMVFTSTLDDTVKIAQAEIDRLLSRGANYTIMLSHLGSDEASAINTPKVVEQLQNLDLLIDGHSHTVWQNGHAFNNGTLGASTGTALEQIGVVTITFDENGEATTTARLMGYKEAQEYPTNEEIQQTIQQFDEDNEKVLGQVVGTLSETLDGEREHVRAGETAMGNVITDAMLQASGADVVITNGGGIRASIKAGEVTVGDVFTVLPFGNAMTVIKVTGQDIIDALNFGVSDYPAPAGKFPHVSGMSFQIVVGDGETPSTVTKISINGEPVDPEKTYTLATNDFMAVGGDGYTMFENHEVLATYGSLAQIVEDYMSELTEEGDGTFSYTVDGRVKEYDPSTEEPEKDEPNDTDPSDPTGGNTPSNPTDGTTSKDKGNAETAKKTDPSSSKSPQTGDVALVAPILFLAAGSALFLMKKKDEVAQ